MNRVMQSESLKAEKNMYEGEREREQILPAHLHTQPPVLLPPPPPPVFFLTFYAGG